MSDVGSARRVKEEVKAAVSGEPWYVGAGVEREDGVGFVVRVTVKNGAGAEARGKVAERVGGVLVKIVESD